jgi:hypothetical protein
VIRQNDGIAFSRTDPHGFLIGRVAAVSAVCLSGSMVAFPQRVELAGVRQPLSDFVACYDRQFFPAARDPFLACLDLPARPQRRSPQFETGRMYTASAPPIDTARLFGVTSLELG